MIFLRLCGLQPQIQKCASNTGNCGPILNRYTGPTSGNGLETARVLAKRGAQIILAARNIAKAETVKGQVEKETPKARLHIIHLDLTSLRSIHKFAAEFKSQNLPLNVLM